MSETAVLVDEEPTEASDSGADASVVGVASVHIHGWGHTTARCSCGWTGRRRLLKAAAVQDAWAHAVHDGCDVSSPLVLAW